MDPQNVYDDPDFFAGYMTLDRQVRGLDGAAEWPTLRSMLPNLAKQRVVDLGCGVGWFSRWAMAEGAAEVVGIDVSANMLERAQGWTDGSQGPIDYRLSDLDQLELPERSADVVFSSLTLHYVNDLARLVDNVARAVVPGGSFVFSVEHPIYSAPSSQQFETAASGDRVWPLDNYLVEGRRVTNWFVDGVVKQHRTIATYANAMIDAGMRLEKLIEWGPTAAEAEANPALADDLHRPWFLLVAATRDP